MKINADKEGNILSWGTETIGVEYSGEVPEDFNQLNYIFLAGNITPNPNQPK